MPNRSSHNERDLKDNRQLQKNLVALGLLSPSKSVEKTSKWPREPVTVGTQGKRRNFNAPTPSSTRSIPYPELHNDSTRRSYSRRLSSERNLAQFLRQPSSPGPRDSEGMIDLDRAYARRDRTFAGSQCIICEEPSEHTLRNERILQLSCSHLSHEACFYEYIRDFEAQRCPGCDATLGLDSGRGGNVLDIEKLSNIVRSLQYPPQPQFHDVRATPLSWEHMDASRHPLAQDFLELQRQHAELLQAQAQMHARSSSNGTSAYAAGPGASSIIAARRNTQNGNSVEKPVNSPRASTVKNPIQPPVIYVRSEYPTLTKSRQQQSLTCLISVEVPEGKWQPDASDMNNFQGQPAQDPEKKTAPNSSPSQARFESPQSQEVLDEITEDLHSRVDNWHGLDFSRFGPLRLHSKLQVGKDRQSWQELECYLFSEMLICIKDKKTVDQVIWESEPGPNVRPKATLKGSIMIKKHLNEVEASSVPLEDEAVLTLKLSVPELPSFHLHFPTHPQLEVWKRALTNINEPIGPSPVTYIGQGASKPDVDQYDGPADRSGPIGNSSDNSKKSRPGRSTEANQPDQAAESRYSQMPALLHAPIDFIVVMPVSSSMHGIKLSLLRDALLFLVQNLGPRDRLGVVAFGANVGINLVTGLTSSSWPGWPKVLESMRATGQKSTRGDLVEGSNIAMDILLQRKSLNPLSSILVISDASTSDDENIDFVVSRAEASKVSIYSFGLGLTHKPDSMIELSTRTGGSYTYVKDWMMLRECIAGCLGAVQSTSHQDVKLKLKLPEGSPAKFTKISGALHVTKRASGRDAEVSLGDLRFGDKRDVLVQLSVHPEMSSAEPSAQDPWESIVSGLEALGGTLEQDEQRTSSVEEVPIVQADLVYGDILRNGVISQSPRPSLLAITMLAPSNKSKQASRPTSLPIPPHPSIVQRRMELLTSDMLTRALTLVARGQNERAHHLLRETRSILKGLGKGGLPPLPSTKSSTKTQNSSISQGASAIASSPTGQEIADKQPPSPAPSQVINSAAGIDSESTNALDAELEAALEWVNHPAVFSRDSRKAVLQAIGAISSQRAYTFRSSLESLWANRVPGIRNLALLSRDWRKVEEPGAEEEE